MPLPRPRAVLFDLDGTLVDSLPTLAKVTNAMLADLGRPAIAQATIRSFVGDGVGALVERALAATGGVPAPDLPGHVVGFVSRYEQAPAAGTRLAEGCIEALDALAAAGIGLAICTNKPERVTRLLLAELGLASRFAAVVGGDTGPTRKPDAGPALDACRRLGLAPGETAFVGDNEHDAACGRAAGCASVIILRSGYTRVAVDDIGADRVIGTLRELPALFGLGNPARR